MLVMIADDNLEQKSEEDQFVVIDEDLDNDLVYRVDDLFVLVDEDSDLVTGHAHAVAFYHLYRAVSYTHLTLPTILRV